jgi:hypothetical protein
MYSRSLSEVRLNERIRDASYEVVLATAGGLDDNPGQVVAQINSLGRVTARRMMPGMGLHEWKRKSG